MNATTRPSVVEAADQAADHTDFEIATSINLVLEKMALHGRYRLTVEDDQQLGKQPVPLKTGADVRRPANDEMVEGFLDGFKDDRAELPESLANRSRSYRHGWLSGRDDRVKKPRASFEETMRAADEAMAADDAERPLP